MVLLTGLVIAGIGLGLSQAGLQTAVLESVSREQSGSASGIFSTNRYIGSIAGSSALPMLYVVGGGAVDSIVAIDSIAGVNGLAGFERVLWVVVASSLAATIASLWIEDRPSTE